MLFCCGREGVMQGYLVTKKNIQIYEIMSLLGGLKTHSYERKLVTRLI